MKRLTDERIKELKDVIRRSKVLYEEAKRTLEKFDRLNAKLLANGELSYKDYSKLITEISAPCHQILDKINLPSQLDDIGRFAHIRTTAPLYAIDETLRSGEWIDLLVVLKDIGFSLNTLFEKPLPSVDIVGAKAEDQPVSKPVDNIFYTYTPFKLRGTRREEYTMLLLPSIRGDSITRRWFSNEVNCFFKDGIKIITPDEVRPTRINELRQLIYVNGEQHFKFEIDRRIGNGVYYCRMGQYISPLRNCNRRECWLWSACGGTRFWSRRPRSFYSIAKVSPNIEVKVDNYGKPEVITKFGDILAFEKINELIAKIYISSVTFLSRYMIRNPTIRLKETIGYRINTRSITIAIDALWLRNFVKELLRRDSTIYTWIYTKHYVLSNLDVNDVRRVSRFFWNLIRSKKDNLTSRFVKGLKSRKLTDDIIDFACEALLHTLSHVIHEEVIAVLQTASNNIVYAYSTKPESDGKFRIFLFENAQRGLGLTESFASRIKRGKEGVIKNIISKILERVRTCGMEVISSIEIEEASKNVRTLINHLDFYNRVLNTTYGISIPVEIARYILAREDSATAKLIDKPDVSAFIDDILSTMPLCWDGCYQCVRLETGCHKPPYEQMFTVSKHLLVALLNEWQGTFRRIPSAPQSLTVVPGKPLVEIGKARNLFGYIINAQKSVRLTSPWISERVAEAICNIAAEKKVSFQILTSLDTSVETHKKALKILLESKLPQIQVKVLKDKQLHAKMFLIDEKLFIIGSANLTLSGLYENVESYVVLSNKEVVEDCIKKFASLWDLGVSLKDVAKDEKI